MIVRSKILIRCLWLSLAICNLTGCMTGATVPNDPESVRYIDSLVAEVLVPGTPITYRNEATPQLLRHFSAKQFAQASVRIQVTDGQPIGPGHTSGLTQVVVGSSDGVTKLAQYTTVTELQRGTATIDIHATKRNNKWELAGIVINIRPSTHH